MAANLTTVSLGIPASSCRTRWRGSASHSPLGVERAGVLLDRAAARRRWPTWSTSSASPTVHTRLTVGAVNVRNGEMRYFDSRDEAVHLDHVLASGALPPAFPAVRIDGDPYWDGGIYSNTPIEAVLDDKPRRDSVIFTVHMWNPEGPEPETLWQVMGRQKDIQYASRARSHIARQKQIHHLRHVIRELSKQLPRASTRHRSRCASSPAGAAARRCTWCASSRPRRRRGSHQGHRLHARRHSRALAGGLRRHDAHASSARRGEAGRSDRRRHHPRRRRSPEPKLAQGIDGFAGRTR